MALILTGSSGSTTLDSSAGLTFSDSSNQQYAASPYVLKNRIINGDMRIDQRNAGASVSRAANSGDAYQLDRWLTANAADAVYTVQQVSDAPTGFINSLKITVTTADSSLGSTQINLVRQSIEGLNVSDLAWGSASAKYVTLSFWVKSSLTGQFGGSMTNSAGNRTYPFNYTISAANTWEQKSITVLGDTTGTWLTTNGVGIRLDFNIGTGSTYLGTANAWVASNLVGTVGDISVVGTNGATWQITGVQLEVGSTATPFERRLYNQELANCQRYYYKLGGTDTNEIMGNGVFQSTTNAEFTINMPVTMRAAPTASYSGTLSNFRITSSATFTPTTLTFDIFGLNTLRASCTVSGATAGYSAYLRSSTSASQTINVSAEL